MRRGEWKGSGETQEGGSGETPERGSGETPERASGEGKRGMCTTLVFSDFNPNGRIKHSLASQPALGRSSLKLPHASDYIRPYRKWLNLQNENLNALRNRI